MSFPEDSSPSAGWQSSTSCVLAVPCPGPPTIPVANHASTPSLESSPSVDSPPSLIVDDGEETDFRTISTVDTPRSAPAKTIYPPRGSTMNSTRSLYDTDILYHEVHHRRYCKNYYMPIDEDEQNRMQLFHDLFYDLLGQRLTTVPLINPRRILDVGTGVGDWAMDMGETYPEAEVVGVDIARIQPRSVPIDNTFFEIEDIEAEGGWVWPEDYFDLVHFRYMYGAFRSWTYIYQEAFKHLAPGGWIEVLEFDCEDSMSKFMDDSTGFPEWLSTVVEATRRAGMLWTNEHLAPRNLEDLGFVDVHLSSIDIPIGVWPKDPETRRSGKHFLVTFLLGLEAICLRVLTEHMGWTGDEVRAACDKLANEVWKIALDPVRSDGFTYKLKVLVGRKPDGVEGGLGARPPVYNWPPRTSSKR